MTASTPATTTASLVYAIKPEDGGHAYARVDPITGKQEKNWECEHRDVVVENLRGKEDSVTLDTAGFQYFKHTSKHTSFATDEEIHQEYYPESIELIKSLTGASRVVVFSHNIRRRLPDQAKNRSQPVAQVHVDHTNGSSIESVHRFLPAADVPQLLEGRFQIINLWRPIANPAIDCPLGLCDYRSADQKDYLPTALIFPDQEAEALLVKYNPDHQWKYLHGMTPDEIVLIKCFDSKQDGSVALFAPHTGFSDPSTPEGTPLRQSIELRTLVFYN